MVCWSLMMSHYMFLYWRWHNDNSDEDTHHIRLMSRSYNFNFGSYKSMAETGLSAQSRLGAFRASLLSTRLNGVFPTDHDDWFDAEKALIQFLWVSYLGPAIHIILEKMIPQKIYSLEAIHTSQIPQSYTRHHHSDGALGNRKSISGKGHGTFNVFIWVLPEFVKW